MIGIALYDEDFFTLKTDYELYAEAIKRLFMTNPGERMGQPYFGVGLRNSLFELNDEATQKNIKNRMFDQAEMYLPQLTILRLETKNEDNSMSVNVGFIIKGDLPSDERILTLEFENTNEVD